MAVVQGKKERSRMQIMHAAKGLFNEKGVQNVTFNEIAKRVDMCRTTIFNHFPTINDLLVALMEQEVTDILEHCEASGLSGNALIETMFDQLIDDMCNYPALTQKLMNNSILNAENHSRMEEFEELVYKNLSGTPEEKEDKIILLGGIFYGMVNHHFLQGLPFDKQQMKERFARLAKPLY